MKSWLHAAALPLYIDHEPMRSKSFIYYVRQLLIRLDHSEHRYFGHSVMIGAATSAAASGIEYHIIPTLGRLEVPIVTLAI